MRDLLQFVDGISAAPSVLLDLNNDSPIYLARDGWSAPPPRLNRAASSSTARDGSLVSQSSYTDRELVITVGLNTTSQDEAAEAIQALGRLLNSEGQWLMYQTTIEPVFFRTKRAEIDGLAEFNGQADGFREVTLRIPAEPFAYGLPVTDTATIANDPTAATNPMSLVLPAIQGDVATPLNLWMSTGSVDVRTTVIASASGAGADAAPVFVDMASSLAQSAFAPWAAGSDVADSDAIGGTVRRATRTVAGVSSPKSAGTFNVPIKPGDYRALIRVRSAEGSGAQVGIGYTDDPLTGPAMVDADTFGGFEWVNAGVIRLPYGAPIPSDRGQFFATPGSASGLTVNVDTPNATSVDVDGVLLIPVSNDSYPSTTFALLNYISSMPKMVVDSINGQAYATSTSGSTVGASPVLMGGFPALLPGVPNRVTILDAGVADVKSATRTVVWTYEPRYLYIRPATS